MHKQRKTLSILAGVGVLTAFLPWVSVLGLIAVSGIDLREGWIVVGIFGAALVVALLGDRATPLAGWARGAIGALGAGAAAFGVWKILQVKDGAESLLGELGGGSSGGPDDELARGAGRMMSGMLGEAISVSFGLYALIAMGAALGIAAALRGK